MPSILIKSQRLTKKRKKLSANSTNFHGLFLQTEYSKAELCLQSVLITFSELASLRFALICGPIKSMH